MREPIKDCTPISILYESGRNVLRKLPPVRNVDGERNTLRPYALIV